MKLGLNIRIDVSKIDKERLFKGAKGTYLELVAFIDTEQKSQFGDNGPLSQAVTKEERGNKVKLPYIGNITVFWDGQSQQNQGYQGNQNQQQPQQGYQPRPPFQNHSKTRDNQQGYQNTPMNKPQSGYSQGPQDNGSDIPF